MPIFITDQQKAQAERLNAQAIVGRCSRCQIPLTSSACITNPANHELVCKACWTAPAHTCVSCGLPIGQAAVHVNSLNAIADPLYAHQACVERYRVVVSRLETINITLAELAASPAASLQNLDQNLLARLEYSIKAIQAKSISPVSTLVAGTGK